MQSSENKAIFGFMLPIVGGTLIMELVTVLVFLVIGKFSLGVILGALWGTAVMTVYYYLMARSVTKASSGDPDQAKKRVQASYSLRLLFLLAAMGVGLYLATSLEIMHWVSLILAVLFPRISIGVWQTISSAKKMLSDKNEGEGE